MDAPPRDLHRLPKVHLHLHLVGSMRPTTLADLAARAGIAPPPTAAHGPLGWARFDARYTAAKDLVRQSGDLVRIVAELAEDEAAAGSGWVEVTTNPALYGGRFGSPVDVLELLLQAGTVAAAATGVGIGWVVSADRRHPGQALALAHLAAAYAGSGVVGFGLANDERANSAAAFVDAFRIARRAGLRSVPHAGELRGPDEVRGALDLLGADRLGHGVRAIEDPRLVARLAATGVHLEVCPASNVAMGVAPSVAAHPLRQLIAAGCSVSLGADDPLLFGEGLVDQYAVARAALGLDDAALAELALAGIAASAAPGDRRRALAAGVRRWLQPADALVAATP